MKVNAIYTGKIDESSVLNHLYKNSFSEICPRNALWTDTCWAPELRVKVLILVLELDNVPAFRAQNIRVSKKKRVLQFNLKYKKISV